MRTLAGWLIIAALLVVGLLLGWAALGLLVLFVILRTISVAFTARPHRYLDEVGVPSPRRVAAAGLVLFAAGGLLTVVGPGLPGLAGRVVVSLAAPLLAVVEIRGLWSLPGAGRSELALGATMDRWPRLVKPAVVVGLALLVAGTVIGVPGAGLPLVAGTVVAVVVGWRHAGRRLATVERARQTVAIACRIGDPLHVGLEVKRWLAGSDDVIASAEAQLPRTWMAADAQGVLQDLRERGGWEGQLDPEARFLWLEHAEPVEPLPERVEWDPLTLPDGLSLTLGAAHTPDGGVGWVQWDPDAADPHALIVGPTRSGKSVLMRCLLAQAVAGGWQVVIADPKGVDYRWADGLPGVERASGDRAYEAIDWAVAEMKDRQAWMEEHAPPTATNLGEVADTPYPPVLVLIDETAELMELGGEGAPKDRKQRQDQTRQGLGRLARRSRFVSIVMCVATQRPDTSIIPGEVRGNLGTRVLLGQGETQHKLMAFGTSDIPNLPANYPRGRARVMIGGAGPGEMQVPWIDTQAILDAHRQAGVEAPDVVPAAWEETADDAGGDRVSLDLEDEDDS